MDDSHLRSSLQRDRRRSDTCKHSHFGSENRHRRCKRFEWMAALGGSTNDRRGHYPASSPAKNAPSGEDDITRLECDRNNHSRSPLFDAFGVVCPFVRTTISRTSGGEAVLESLAGSTAMP